MARVPRNVNQADAIRAFVRGGGVAIRRRGKGSHLVVVMPNHHRLTIPQGVIKVGTLHDLVNESGLTMEEFIELL